jgi:hypothetical protein
MRRSRKSERGRRGATRGPCQTTFRRQHWSWRWVFFGVLAIDLLLLFLWLCRAGVSTLDLDVGRERVGTSGPPSLTLSLLICAAGVAVAAGAWALIPLAIGARASIRCTRALRALRQPPNAALLQAASGIVPWRWLYCVPDDEPYAVCLGLWRPEIYVSTGLCARLSPSALRAALAHEESHRRRRDPLRLLVVHAATWHLLPQAQRAAVHGRVELRGEIMADRFAGDHVSTSALAAALLVVLRTKRANLARTIPIDALTPTQQTASVWLDGSSQAIDPTALDVRLRYLSLPAVTPLPARLSEGTRLGTVTRQLVRRFWWVGVLAAIGAAACISLLFQLWHPAYAAVGCVV